MNHPHPSTPDTTAIPYTPAQRVLHFLTIHQECSRGDLLDVSGLQSYPALDLLLFGLIEDGKITAHWHDLGFRSYRLTEVKPNPPWWMLPPKPE